MFLIIGEINMIKGNIALNLWKFPGILLFLDFRFRIERFKYAVSCS